ncbi:MAG: hypothetical protein HC794_09360 [Nitrospiraceae bacterium]|nr:hypothetical protein [Nitrospiraceae bacterium]
MQDERATVPLDMEFALSLPKLDFRDTNVPVTHYRDADGEPQLVHQVHIVMAASSLEATMDMTENVPADTEVSVTMSALELRNFVCYMRYTHNAYDKFVREYNRTQREMADLRSEQRDLSNKLATAQAKLVQYEDLTPKNAPHIMNTLKEDKS